MVSETHSARHDATLICDFDSLRSLDARMRLCANRLFLRRLSKIKSATINAPSWALPLPEGVLGTVTELLCATGSRIHLDEVVAVIETDKLAVDVKAQSAGVVTSILVEVE